METKEGTAATKAKNRYNAKNYDQIPLRVPKGDKEIIKEYAESHGDSLNGFICKAINEKLNRM